MKTVTIDGAGKIGLPEETLEQSCLKPGAELVVLAENGRITLIDRERFRQLVERPTQALLARFQESLKRNPRASFFGGLTFEEYAALSDEEEEELWNRLWAEAERKVKLVERDVPADFRPAGQKRR